MMVAYLGLGGLCPELEMQMRELVEVSRVHIFTHNAPYMTAHGRWADKQMCYGFGGQSDYSSELSKEETKEEKKRGSRWIVKGGTDDRDMRWETCGRHTSELEGQKMVLSVGDLKPRVRVCCGYG